MAGRERMFPLVDHDHSAAADPDEQNVNLGIRVFGHLVAGWPRQESRVQVTAGHPPQRPGPCPAQQVHHRLRL
jgi:hypothetical protein